jgi:hypothetical protein
MKSAPVIMLLMFVACAEGAPPVADPWLASGEYRFQITATEGSKKARSVGGSLSLRQTHPDDRSPLGHVAKDRDIARHPLFGWTDAPLQEVGAPMSSDGPEPKAESMDPVYPGVLVDTGWKPTRPRGRPSDAPILWVGSVTNRRDGSRWTDGGGIVLFVMRRAARCLNGIWQEAGIVRDGRGRFSLCQI